jgi:hypothetical protein
MISLILLLQQANAFSTSVGGRQDGPSGFFDYAVVVFSVIVVIWVYYLCIKGFFKRSKKEKAPDHIKRRILQEDF